MFLLLLNFLCWVGNSTVVSFKSKNENFAFQQVALPAAMELWLAEDRWGSAVALVVCHLVPPYVVDAAIYSEVRHGIHPWITGTDLRYSCETITNHCLGLQLG